MCLSVLLAYRVVELEGFETCTSHEKEGDVLDVFSLLLVCVLFVYEEHVSAIFRYFKHNEWLTLNISKIRGSLATGSDW